jgi:hypothetical protein
MRAHVQQQIKEEAIFAHRSASQRATLCFYSRHHESSKLKGKNKNNKKEKKRKTKKNPRRDPKPLLDYLFDGSSLYWIIYI